MRNSAQLIRSLGKSIQNSNLIESIKLCTDETNTRARIIHPFLELLGFKQFEDYTHEYVADISGKKGTKVDIAITFGKKTPSIIIECKKTTSKLTDKHFKQLNDYVVYTPSAKVGVLTNGIIWDFYIRGESGLNNTPFYSFNLEDFTNSDLEILTMFMKSEFNVNEIQEEADSIHFLEKFDDAFFSVLNNPTPPIIKSLNEAMGGKRATDKIAQKISSLINSISVKGVYERMIVEEAKLRGVITTEEEYKAFNVIKTVLAMSSKFKNSELDRIGFRDQKSSFKILIDDNQKKCICDIIIKDKVSYIEINKKKHLIEGVTVADITKLKKEIVQSAINNLK
ncbi:type I restriction enzyme HsdR N-terminal domain-containing protein [Flavobacteriaceae bacterium]|nr:type I restriction enzyme HsdR N-terminal domain-containing protein [Flavobacteriaceae bacterium]